MPAPIRSAVPLAVEAGRMGWNDLMTARYPELAPLARAAFAPLTLATGIFNMS